MFGFIKDKIVKQGKPTHTKEKISVREVPAPMLLKYSKEVYFNTDITRQEEVHWALNDMKSDGISNIYTRAMAYLDENMKNGKASCLASCESMGRSVKEMALKYTILNVIYAIYRAFCVHAFLGIAVASVFFVCIANALNYPVAVGKYAIMLDMFEIKVLVATIYLGMIMIDCHRWTIWKRSCQFWLEIQNTILMTHPKMRGLIPKYANCNQVLSVEIWPLIVPVILFEGVVFMIV